MKKSKRGRLMLVEEDGKFVTKPLEYHRNIHDRLVTRYKDGVSYNDITFDQIRANAKLAPR
jgi:hypothetical protein